MNLPGTVITPRKFDGLARADEEAAERNAFVSEGQIGIGHFELSEERGCTDLGRVSVTVERLGQEVRPESDPDPG